MATDHTIIKQPPRSSGGCRPKVDQIKPQIPKPEQKDKDECCDMDSDDVPVVRAERKGSSDEKNSAVVSKRLRRAFSVHQEPLSEETNKYSPKQKEKTIKSTTFVKFGTVSLPTPGSGFFKQRASFHADTASASTSSSPTPIELQNEGIVCSNSDLRSILSDAQGNRKRSVDLRGERMKNHRSLSFDSSMFRLPRRSESPVFVNKSIPHGRQSPKETREEGRNIIQIRVTSDESNDENKEALLLIASVQNKSDVAWDEKKMVDASILGNAIETYLGEKKTTETTGDQVEQEASLCSSLRSLFVK